MSFHVVASPGVMFHKQTTCDALVNRTLVVNIGYFRHNIVVLSCVDIAPLENENEVDFGYMHPSK